MKKYIIPLIILCSAFWSGCEKFLDQVPEEKLSEDNLFDSKDDVVKVLTKVYSYEISPIEFSTYAGQASDEADYNWTNYAPSYKDDGEFGPTSPVFNIWSNCYEAIRTSMYFQERLDDCVDPKLSDQERSWWRGEAEYLEAYYYFLLWQQYGPVPIIDHIYQPDEVEEAIENDCLPRVTSDDMLDFIDDLIVRATSKLDTTYTIPDRAGRANASACWFLRSRLWLYAASPLYNGLKAPNGKSYSQLMIKGVKGEDLMNKTVDINRWKKAMDYAQKAIDVATVGNYHLFTGDSKFPKGMLAYKRLFEYPRGGEPSCEMIFYRQDMGSGNIITHSLPLSWSGYSGICPTMEGVNQYFTANGLLPKDDPDYPKANEFETYEKDGLNITLYKRFMKRDPRFYANILFPERYSYAMLTADDETYNQKWCMEPNSELAYFRPYVSGQDGFNNKTGRDYCSTGFLEAKWIPTSISKDNHGDYAVPIFRFTELYLNYTEAAFEYAAAQGQNAANNPDVFKYWDLVRDRVGMPGVKESYQKAGISLNNEKLRELIHAERRVEFAFEGQSYFDNRRWLDAEREGGAKHGMNIMKDKDNGFWDESYVFETRYWNSKLYYMPLNQNELDKNFSLTQNPNW